MYKPVYARGLYYLLPILLLLQGLSSCVPTTPNIAQVSKQGSVWRVEPVVWAGKNPPLPEINNSAAATVIPGAYIQTNEDGIAKVKFENCEYIYLYRNSVLSKGTCTEDSQGSGNWLCNGAIEVNCQSNITIFTPSSKIEVVGTRFFVEYLPAIELTLLQVMDGQVNVWPVLAPSLTPEDPNNLGSMVTIDENFFWFTIPSPQPFNIDRFQSWQLYPFMDWNQFERAIKEFSLPEGNQVDGWLDQMKNLSTNLGLDFPVDLLKSGLVLYGDGQLLRLTDVQDIILSAVDWNQWMRKNRISEDLRLTTSFPNRDPIDVLTLTFDPDMARKLVSKLNLRAVPENTLIVLVPMYSREFELANQELASQLKETGLAVEIIQVAPEELQFTLQAFLAEGRSIIWFSQP